MKKNHNELKDLFVKAQREKNTKCLEPNEQCQNTLINSHSIQDSRILNELSEKKHIYTLDYDITKLIENHPQPIIFKLKSIHKATTFNGLCNKHDTEIFKPIDTEKLNMRNKEHVFLLTYRAVLKELVSQIEAFRKTQKFYLNKIDAKIIDPNVPDYSGILACCHCDRAYDTYQYKRKYDYIYLNKAYNNIYYMYIILNEKANFAVSSIFTPLEMAQNKDNPEHIGINIFPYNNKTYILFSALYEEKQALNRYINSVITATGVYQKYLISKIVLRNCENIVISPSYFKTWSDKKKNTILQYFQETIYTDKKNHDSKYLYLF